MIIVLRLILTAVLLLLVYQETGCYTVAALLLVFLGIDLLTRLLTTLQKDIKLMRETQIKDQIKEYIAANSTRCPDEPE